MKALSRAEKGAAFKVISCLLECTRGTQFELTADERCLKDIGFILNIDKNFKAVSTEDSIDRDREPIEDDSQPKKLGACIVHEDLKMTEDELVNYLKRNKRLWLK